MMYMKRRKTLRRNDLMKYDPQTTKLSKIVGSELPLLLLFPFKVTRTLIDLLLVKSDIKLYNDSAIIGVDITQVEK